MPLQQNAIKFKNGQVQIILQFTEPIYLNNVYKRLIKGETCVLTYSTL